VILVPRPSLKAYRLDPFDIERSRWCRHAYDRLPECFGPAQIAWCSHCRCSSLQVRTISCRLLWRRPSPKQHLSAPIAVPVGKGRDRMGECGQPDEKERCERSEHKKLATHAASDLNVRTRTSLNMCSLRFSPRDVSRFVQPSPPLRPTA
jgi:hypothetical protein